MGSLSDLQHKGADLAHNFADAARRAYRNVIDELVMDGTPYDDEAKYGLEAHLIAKSTGLHPARIQQELRTFRQDRDTSQLTAKQVTNLVKTLVDTPPRQQPELKLASISSIVPERRI